MDPAVNLPILPPIEERARVPFFPVGINPVVNPVNPRQILLYQVSGCAISPVRKPNENMPEDVATATCYPQNEIFRNPWLVPSPFLAALPALQAVLGHHIILSPEQGTEHPEPAISLQAGAWTKKTISLHSNEMPGYRAGQPGPSVNPAAMAGYWPVFADNADTLFFIKKGVMVTYGDFRSALIFTVPFGALTEPLLTNVPSL